MASPSFMLTPLRSGHAFKAATGSGRWEPISGTLGELGEALDVADGVEVDVVRSTPDPWSQARAFADAVLRGRRGDPLIRQWRGLLALFALSDFYGERYRLELKSLDLAASSSRFADVMRRLVPKASLPLAEAGDALAWDRPVLVRVAPAAVRGAAGMPVGILNPACLVAGGRDLGLNPVPGVPWARTGLDDPTSLAGRDALPPAALQLLAAYLRDLKDGLSIGCVSSGVEAEQAMLRALLQQIERFADDCLDPVRHPGASDHVFDLTEAERIEPDLPDLYGRVASFRKAREPEPGTSDCILAIRPELAAALPFKGLVLLDPAIGTPERPANTVTFWGLRTLEDALSSGPEARQALRARMAEQGYVVVEPDDLFAPILVQLDEEDRPARIDANPETLRDALLPLSPVVLLLADPDRLRDTVVLARDGRVAFDVTLGGRVHRLSRRYVERPGEGQGRLLREADWSLGDVVLWPDFVSDRWSNYCARIDNPTNDLGRVRGRFAMSGALMAALLGSGIAPAPALARWGAGIVVDAGARAGVLDQVPEFATRRFASASLTRLRASATGGRASEIQVSSLPFEAVFYSVALDAAGPPVAAGCALLRPARVSPAEQHVRSAPVAIDFGTTNTVACLQGTDPVVLAARTVHPISPARGTPAGRSVELAQRLRDFMPADERVLPTPTVVITRALDAEAREVLDADGELDDALLMRQAMYFQPDFAEDGTIAAVPLRDWTALLNSIRYDLKWAPGQEVRDAARRYLRQLMMMIAAEWTRKGGDPARLRWHFSRPRDMGGDREFVAEIERALRQVVPKAPPGAVRPLRYEGEAAAQYILDERSKGSGTRGSLNVILDIGGGTTDIAVWTGGAEPERLLSVSLRLAGGDFFTDHIMANPDILGDFGLRTWADVVRNLGRESDASLRDNIRYIGELLFSGKTLDRAIERTWSRVSGTDRARAMKETSFLFLGGVAWYVGRHLRELVRSGRIERAALQDIAVAFCGRGSGLFRRLHGDDPRAQTDISRILLLMAVAAGDGRPRFPQVQVSPHPKIEVAAGMILMATRDGDGDGTGGEDRQEAGLVFDIDDEPDDQASSSRGDRPGDEDAYVLARLDIGMEDLEPFLKAFSQVSGFKLSIAEHQRAKLVNGAIDVDRADAKAGRPAQPEFATALKVLVGLMNAPRGDAVRPAAEWK